MALLLFVALLGPAQTLSGKYPRHAPAVVARWPAEPVALPDPLPTGVDELCALVEAGQGTPEVYAALGEALLRDGKGALAYRAFRKAQLARPEGDWQRAMQARKDACPYVSEDTIRREEREAALWVARLQAYEEDRIANGQDPLDLGPFYARHGRPEEDYGRIVAARRASWIWGAAAGVLGVAAAVAAFLKVWRVFALLPLLLGGWCLVAPGLTGQVGLYYGGGACAVAGGLLLLWRGRKE